jgi:hypothetical protein
MDRPREEVLVAICAIAARGEAERGSDGLVMFNKKNETACWMKLSDLPTEELREIAADMLTEEGNRFFFVLDEDTDNRQVHIWKLSRQEVTARTAHMGSVPP